jgi:O-antigen ligase
MYSPARARPAGVCAGAAARGWQRIGRKRLLASMLVSVAIAAALAFSFSAQFGSRVERSMAALSGDRAGLNDALSGRLSIWHAAAGMIGDHPVNGVGIAAATPAQYASR